MPRIRNLYDPESVSPYRLSRTKLENFLNCPRCFYLDRRLGVGQPPGFPFNINSAVDELLNWLIGAVLKGWVLSSASVLALVCGCLGHYQMVYGLRNCVSTPPKMME